MSNSYDAIVVGARCAGSPTAMLLARKGYRVLVVDRATFPSDTLSTHFDPRPGRGRAAAAGDCSTGWSRPAARRSTRYSFDFGPFTIAGRPGPTTASRPATPAAHRARQDPRRRGRARPAPRCARASPSRRSSSRTARSSASAATAQDGASVVERARVVIGADGRNSLVAKAVAPEQYNEKPMLHVGYYTYWSGLPIDGFEIYDPARPRLGRASRPTTASRSSSSAGPYAESTAYKADVEGNYLKTLELAPEFAERVRGARRARSASPAARCPNFFRKPYGPGLGARRRRRIQQGPDHRAGDHRRVPRRRAVRRARSTQPSPARARSTTRWPTTSTTRDAHVLPMYEFTTAARDAGAAAARDAAAARRGARQPGRDGRVRQHQRRHRVAGRVLRPDNVGRLMSASPTG